MRKWLIPAIILLLALLSVLTLSSIAPSLAVRQMVFFGIGFGLFAAMSTMHIRRLEYLSPMLYAGLCALLLITLALAPLTKGSARWIDIGTLFSIQPSQLAIPVVTLFILYIFHKRSLQKPSNILLFLLILLLPAILIFAAPDLGTTIVFLATTGTLLLFKETPLKYIFALAGVVIAISLIGWFFLLEPYQKSRITSFLDSDGDPRGSGYNARQSLIAAGSGQLFGRGLGQGTQSHLRFLPERQTDFVFASFAEEAGFVGSIVLLGLYASLIYTTLQVGKAAHSSNEQLFCLVVVVFMSFQTTVNIGMNIGLLPITGVTLPFFSYGGSSILVLMTTYGIVQSIHMRQDTKLTLHLR